MSANQSRKCNANNSSKMSKLPTESGKIPPRTLRTTAFFDSIINALPILVVVKEAATGRIIFWNRAAEEITGYFAAEVIGKQMHDLVPDTQAEIFARDDQAVLDTQKSLEYPHIEVNTRRGRRVLQIIKTPVMLNSSRPLIVSIGQDITAQFDLEQDVEKQRHLTQAIINAIDVQIALLDQDGTIVALNEAWESSNWTAVSDQPPLIFGTNLIEEFRSTPATGKHPCASEIIDGLNAVLSRAHSCFNLEYETISKGRSTHNLFKVHPLSLDHFRGAVVSQLDITRRKQAELALQERHDIIATKVKKSTADLQLFEKIFHSALEGITVTDTNGVILNVNEAFTRITGYSRTEALGRNPRILKSDRHDDEFYQQMWIQLATVGIWEGEIWNRRKNGEVYPEWLSINSIIVPEDGTVNYVAVFHDITQLKEKEERIEHLAYRDPLTGLPNRALLLDRMEMLLKRAKREEKGVAVLCIDLDNFKNINDSLGHPVGDQLLCDVASQLSGLLRSSDTIARISADEFIAVCPFEQDIEVLTLADRLQKSFQQIFHVQNHSFYLTLSIGIAVFPADGTTGDKLIQHADIALNQAKAQGKNRFRLYDEEMNSALVSRLNLERELRDAVEEGTIKVHYQPQINLTTGKILGFEALARWTRQDGSVVPPDQFISIAEETGVIDQLGLHILTQACRDMQTLAAAGFPGLRLSVNLSAVQFRDHKLAARIIDAIKELEFDSFLLELEITETIMMTNLQLIEATLNQLHSQGMRISVDDFGTGYSSLAYLKRFPIAALKIDRSFIADIANDSNDKAIVEAILTMAKALNIETIAEGVEDEEQQAFLAERGCDIVQGYYYSRPLPLDQLLFFMQDSQLAHS